MEEYNIENINIVIEEDFWQDFIQEAFEHIDDIEMNILTLEKEPENTEIIHSMFRAFHTIKGLSGFVEHSLIQEISHKTETLMDYCRKGESKVTADIINAILKSSDLIKNLCSQMNAWKNNEVLHSISSHMHILNTLIDSIEQSHEMPSENSPVETEHVQTDSETNESVETVQENVQVPDEDAIICFENKDTESFLSETLAIENTQTQTQIEDSPGEVVEENSHPPCESLNETPLKPESKALPAQQEYMKVANSKIDHLVDIMGELIINQSLMKEYVNTNYSQDDGLLKNFDSISRITRELQDISMFLRMVSLRSTFQKLSRIARDTINELGKDIEFVTKGESTEIDRVVADKLLEPLVHLIKNAISHGIEDSPEDRIAKGKPPKGRVELNAYNKRGKIYIEIKDDGRGINTEVVLKKAIEKGLAESHKEYTDEEIREFIMLPGFSTAKKVDNISGRGVGMDVVKTQIAKISGKISITSTQDLGSTFTLAVPVNHAIMNGIVTDILGEHFIVPTVNIREIIQPLEENWIYTNNKRTMLNVRDQIIPVIMLSKLMKQANDDMEFPIVMILELDSEYRVLPITNVINRQEVVVKPLSEDFSALKYLSGMSILGTGQVSLILDIPYLFSICQKRKP